MRKLALAWGLSLCTAAAVGPGASAARAADSGAAKVDPKLPSYAKANDVSGAIKSVGSDTMNELMAFWAEGFKKHYPSLTVEVEGKGSATAPVALTEGTATFGPMSREMTKEEVDKFKAKFGYAPTGLKTGIDMLAVYVHKDNPVAKRGLTFEQLDAIFSKNRKGGGAKDARTWGDVGLDDPAWKDQPITLYGRNASSGTYLYFKEHVLKKGDYKDEVKEQAGSSTVVQSVGKDRYAIGYSGIGYKTADVQAVPLYNPKKEKLVEATEENLRDYPLARYLYVYVNCDPAKPLDPLRREFVRYVFSKEGQLDVIKAGYLPLPAARAALELKPVGLDK